MIPARIRLVECESAAITFPGAAYDVTFRDGVIRFRTGGRRCAEIRQISQQVAYKSRLLGGVVLDESRTGDLDYERHFAIDWDEDEWLPELSFRTEPTSVVRRYRRGQAIELGLEDVGNYVVRYADGVEAEFREEAHGRFRFSFSTGFYGSFRVDPDGSTTIRFRGDRLKPSEEPYRSQSKFVVSRSKYSGNLLLILQDDAAVRLG